MYFSQFFTLTTNKNAGDIKHTQDNYERQREG